MAGRRKETVYVSSTFVDLERHRAALKTALERTQYDVACMEKYPAFDEQPVDKCLAEVADGQTPRADLPTLLSVLSPENRTLVLTRSSAQVLPAQAVSLAQALAPEDAANPGLIRLA